MSYRTTLVRTATALTAVATAGTAFAATASAATASPTVNASCVSPYAPAPNVGVTNITWTGAPVGAQVEAKAVEFGTDDFRPASTPTGAVVLPGLPLGNTELGYYKVYLVDATGTVIAGPASLALCAPTPPPVVTPTPTPKPTNPPTQCTRTYAPYKGVARTYRDEHGHKVKFINNRWLILDGKKVNFRWANGLYCRTAQDVQGTWWLVNKKTGKVFVVTIAYGKK
jgi:hypothetical protein